MSQQLSVAVGCQKVNFSGLVSEHVHSRLIFTTYLFITPVGSNTQLHKTQKLQKHTDT